MMTLLLFIIDKWYYQIIVMTMCEEAVDSIVHCRDDMMWKQSMMEGSIDIDDIILLMQ